MTTACRGQKVCFPSATSTVAEPPVGRSVRPSAHALTIPADATHCTQSVPPDMRLNGRAGGVAGQGVTMQSL
jgi:hypothetical protein